MLQLREASQVADGFGAHCVFPRAAVCCLCSCKGKGSEKDGAVQKCTGCKGQGVRIVMHRIGPGMVRTQHSDGTQEHMEECTDMPSVAMARLTGAHMDCLLSVCMW